jgi:hypothetical protein
MYQVRRVVLISLMLCSFVALFTGTASANAVTTPVQTSTAYVLTINGQDVSGRQFVLSDTQQPSIIYNLTVSGATLAYLIRRDYLTGCPVGQPFPKSCLILQDLGLLHPIGNWGIGLLTTTAYQYGQSQQYIVLWQGSGPYLIGNWIIAQYKRPVIAEQIAGNQVNLSLS